MNPTLDDKYNYSFNTIEWCENIIIKPNVDNKVKIDYLHFMLPTKLLCAVHMKIKYLMK